MIQLVVLFLLLVQAFNGYAVWAIAIDNGVEGEPIISCGANEITFTVSTRRPFEGKVFVKGEYGKPNCTAAGGATRPTGQAAGQTTGSSPFTTASSAAAHFTGVGCPPCPVCENPGEINRQSSDLFRPVSSLSARNLAQIVLQIGTCNMKRERSLNPTGVTLGLAIVVSFHQQFITKVDRAYQLRCFYMETEKTVTSVVDVSMPQTTELVAQVPMPICSYTIRRGSPDGPEVQYAKVGDVVYHRWQCTTSNPSVFGMLVHSCYVADGKGQRVEVINNTGCSLDSYVINDLNYETPLLAYVEAHVFKFADQAVLDFQCAINICVKEGDGCAGVTVSHVATVRDQVVHVRPLQPPICGRRRSRRNLNELDEQVLNGTIAGDNDWDLHAHRLMIVDIDDGISSEDLARLEKERDAHSRPQFAAWLSSHYAKDDTTVAQRTIFQATFCLSVTAFGVLVSSCTFLLTVSVALLTILYFMRQKN